ncbi:MAG: chlorophyll a/b-binding protein [Cyanobacteria bacterium P01_D01_bin.1]
MENEAPLVPVESSTASDALANKTLGVSATQYYKPEPKLGFTPYAELWNGRLAMVGFFIALAFELLSAHAF